jgi:hypothetical protein
MRTQKRCTASYVRDLALAPRIRVQQHVPPLLRAITHSNRWGSLAFDVLLSSTR